MKAAFEQSSRTLQVQRAGGTAKRRIVILLAILCGVGTISTLGYADSRVRTVHNTNRTDMSPVQMACIKRKMEVLGFCDSCQVVGANSLVCDYDEARYHSSETLTSRVANKFAEAVDACAPRRTLPRPGYVITMDCVARKPLGELGYLSGHKTRYCFSEGYDSYDPVRDVCTRNCAANGNEIRLPLKKTDYLSGHKTRYCIGKGFAGYRPASGGDKDPIYGYCYKARVR